MCNLDAGSHLTSCDTNHKITVKLKMISQTEPHDYQVQLNS